MINLGLISDINEKRTIGALGIDIDSGELAYFTEDEALDNMLDEALQDTLFQTFLEHHEGITVEHQVSLSSKDGQYLAALNYELPFPWRITEARTSNKDLETALNELYLLIYEGDLDE